jgi:putative MATE family efflux protein
MTIGLGLANVPILRLMNYSDEIMPDVKAYMGIIYAGLIVTAAYNALAAFLRALGDSKSPLYFLIISAMLNVALDLLFVGVLGMGVGGAAFATVISQAVSAFLGLRKLMKATESYRLIPRKIRFNGRMLQKVLYIGIPSGLQNAVIALANVVVQTNINDFGALAQAGCGAYSKIEGFGFLPITSFTLALTTFIGQNLGAQEYERAKKGARFGLIACASIAEAIGLAIYAFIPALIAMFIQSGDAAQVQEVIRLGTMHARIMTPFYFLLALSNAMAAVLRGAGRSIVPMIVMLCCWCVFRVTYITIAVPIRPELTTISWAYPITWGLSSIIFLIYYNVVDWVHAYGRSKPRKMA